MQIRRKVLPYLMASLVALLFPMNAFAEPVKIEEGTPIRLKLMNTISSGKNHEGDNVSFEVVDDVFAADGKTLLIKSGTGAWGTVSQVQERGRIGEKGELSLSIDGTKAVDGKKVPLRASISREGKGKLGTVIALSLIVTPLFLFMRGKDAKVPAGTPISAYIDRDVMIDVPSSGSTAKVSPGRPQENAEAVPAYLEKYVDNNEPEAIKALDQLYNQGLLTQEEYEAKKNTFLKK